MITAALAFTLLLQTPAPNQAEHLVEPSDDVWVYPHASDPGTDAYLRVWGVGGLATAGKGEPADDFSYGYLQFDLSFLSKGVKVVGASLKLTQTPNPGYSPEAAKAAPMEARILGEKFDEKTWNYGLVSKIAPESVKESIFGTGYPEKWTAGEPVPFSIDLMKNKGVFLAAVTAALAKDKPSIAMALTSTLDPSEGGQSAIYKVFSKEGPKGSRPVLRLVVERG